MGRELNWILSCGLVLGLAALPAQADSKAQAIPYGEIRSGEGGYVRVSAIGLPPFGATEEANARVVARQNAVNLAQRRLLSAILELPLGPTKVTVRDRLAARPQARERLRSLIARARVTGTELADGSAEVTLELPFSGPHGLSEFLAGLSQ